MTILKSVGEKGVNDKIDVKVIQAGLNLAQSAHFKLKGRLVVDGKKGDKTVSAIKAFQQHIVKLSHPDGRIDAEGTTLKILKKNIAKGLNEDSLMAIMAKGSSSTVTLYLDLLNKALPNYHVDTPLRISHFLAQIGHESMSFVYTEEIASGAAYEGREDLGNTEEGDGVRFKGRGLLQLTGRDNYKRYGKYIETDLLQLGNEKIISTTPKYALDVSLWYWENRKLNKHADKDDLKTITHRVNGGDNGLADRERYLNRAKFFLTA